VSSTSTTVPKIRKLDPLKLTESPAFNIAKVFHITV